MTPEHTEVMKRLQELLVSSAVLSVECASIRDAMYQIIGNKIKYFGFIAYSLSLSEQRRGSSKRELAAVAYAFKKFLHWLYGRRFRLFVNN